MQRLWPQTVGMSDQISPGKDQKILTPVFQSNQKKIRAMVARSHEDGEGAFMCVNVEGLKSSGNSKKRSLNGLASNDGVIYSSAGHAQSNDSQTYIGVGKLNGRPVKVLQDTCCTEMIVDSALIPDSMVIPGSSGWLQMVDHTLMDVTLANVYLDSPYYKGNCKVMCSAPPYTL